MENQNGNHLARTAAVAFFLGAMAGGITALLLAPRTGAQMRSSLKHTERDRPDRESHRAHENGDKAATKRAASEARIVHRKGMQKRRSEPRAAVAGKGEQA